MDQVTLLTPAHGEADLSLGTANTLLSALTPTFVNALRLQRMIHAVSAFLCFQAYILACTTLYASKIVALNGWLATKVSASTSATWVWYAWESQTCRALRKKAFHEVATFILGGGQTVFLMVFWPGWLVLGPVAGGVWMMVG
ncbi:uncharacterized protein F5Z01DRAFT_626558 [Emericellopsis atlantica]|uniref:Uncharacterized protein n=1 Tax=Emericellopsis atlantica TaxID=2614577 RepID=A0A9P8CM19_9HYPO|nr:uncharacterized protein F5Z01DRAFT_626558 [Emericellopsis atlantica]KAG9251983.1 hypothetical protein F5Z01DRAFT_626558 [Emericellopsis atlantica]